jgi:hypothetical protein
MIVFASFIVFVAFSESAARYYEARQIELTHVSTLLETDYARPALANGLALGGAGAAIVALLIGVYFAVPVIAGLSIMMVYAIVRVTLVTLTLSAARLSISMRLRQAMAHTDIRNARIAFHFSGVDYPSPSHFHMWESELEAVDAGILLLLREHKHLIYERLRNSRHAILLPDAPAIAEFSSANTTSLRAVFYANNSMKNNVFIKAFPRVTHVQLLHGDSDKTPSFNPTTKIYDLIFVAGRMGIDRYARNGVTIPAEKFCIVGRPQARAILDAPHGAGRGLRKVIYMPTWSGLFEDTQFSSLAQADQIIEKILASDQPTQLDFKPHPLSYKDPQWPQLERAIRAALGKTRANGNRGVFRTDATEPFDLYNEADVVITDISSVVIDYLYSGKPFLVILPVDFNAAKDAERFPSLEAGYQVTASLENLSSQFNAAIGDDPLKAKRKAVRLYAFGDYGRPPGEAFREAGLALLDDDCDTSPTTGEGSDHDK